MLLKPREDDYIRSLPGAEHVLLAIEVADSSLAFDRDRKLPLFASHGIPEAWLVDCTADTLTVHLNPGANGYESVAVADLSTPIPIGALPDIRHRPKRPVRLTRSRTTAAPGNRNTSAARPCTCACRRASAAG